ncbi:MAG: hypothetical protein V4541_08155 [Bacteroidota bacterium]
MKQITILIITVLLATTAFAQLKNPTNKKEIDDKIKQAQQQFDKLTPEQKKMLEQMGMSTKVPTMPTGITDASVKSAMSGGSAFGVPSKNNSLISAIPQIILTDANMASYVVSINKYIPDHLGFEGKASGKYYYKGLKSNKYNTVAIANTAIGLWASGQLESAMYLMGKASADDVKNIDNLSNLSAMLSMSGAPHMAIPLLEYLNKSFPNNSTILNNLGQAWFYMGVIDKADTYLQQTIKAFAYHPQANQTECLIQQSKGNTTKAIECMKNSLKYSYSLNKVNMLRKLGYSAKGSDTRNPFHPDPNPLGLKDFVRPDYPKNYDEEVQLKYVWDNFEKDIVSKEQILNQQLQPYIIKQIQKAQQTYNSISKPGGTGLSTTSAGPTLLYQQTAQRNLDEMNKDGGQAYRLKAAKKKVYDLIKSFEAGKETAHKNFEKQFSSKATQETELAKKGEDLGYDDCKVKRAYSEWVYKNYNQPLQQTYKEYLHQLRLKMEEELYWGQFIQEADVFAVTQINAKKEWLASLSIRYLETAYITENNACKVPSPNKEKKIKLADFDDMNCKYHTELDFGFGNKIETNCNKMSVTFSGGPLSGNLNYHTNNKGKDLFTNATIEATVIDKGVGVGPLQVGAKAGMGMEFTSNGVEDVYVNGEASVATVTASGKMSLISGNMSGGISGFGP